MARDNATDREDQFFQLIDDLNRLRSFEGQPPEFWPAYLSLLVELTEAAVGMVLIRTREQPSWRQIAILPETQKAGFYAKIVAERIEEIGLVSQTEGYCLLQAEGGFVLASKLEIGEEGSECIAVVFVSSSLRPQAVDRLKALQFACDIPVNYQLSRIARESRTRVEHFSSVLDFMVLVNSSPKFLSCAMTFCNELAARLKCERVSLGWYEKGYIRLEAMSHVDHFDRKMEAVQQLEAAMEETFDQDMEIMLPPLPDSGFIAVAHKEYAAGQKTANICSLPLRIDEEAVAVCLCERTEPFTEVELRLLRLACDQAIRRLSDLKRSDRWAGARLASAARERLAKLLGFQNTWAKALAILISLILAIVCFVPVPFRVQAPLILRTQALSYLTAGIDAHIDKVFVRVGDRFKQGDELLTLDRSELLLEEASAIAEQDRYQREFEKARSLSALADMRVAEAMRDQATAKLGMIRYRLDKSVIRAPFDGVIVEGDLNERIGAPVKQGDVLLKAARTEGLYTEMDVKESDIHHVKDNADGEIALVSRPQDSYKIKLTLVEPAAVVREKGNVFIAHADFKSQAPDWWQPGMTGVAKINAGKRTLLWILTRRTIDFLRLKLWW
ncbi:MAG: efflux RND transporter periplasmic adaptor subunit [Deltaproteobacteria bacterium]